VEPHFHSLADVYKLFKEQHAENMASRQVFSDEFRRMNLALFMPKKDQCDEGLHGQRRNKCLNQGWNKLWGEEDGCPPDFDAMGQD